MPVRTTLIVIPDTDITRSQRLQQHLRHVQDICRTGLIKYHSPHGRHPSGVRKGGVRGWCCVHPHRCLDLDSNDPISTDQVQAVCLLIASAPLQGGSLGKLDVRVVPAQARFLWLLFKLIRYDLENGQGLALPPSLSDQASAAPSARFNHAYSLEVDLSVRHGCLL